LWRRRPRRRSHTCRPSPRDRSAEADTRMRAPSETTAGPSPGAGRAGSVHRTGACSAATFAKGARPGGDARARPGALSVRVGLATDAVALFGVVVGVPVQCAKVAQGAFRNVARGCRLRRRVLRANARVDFVWDGEAAVVFGARFQEQLLLGVLVVGGKAAVPFGINSREAVLSLPTELEGPAHAVAMLY